MLALLLAAAAVLAGCTPAEPVPELRHDPDRANFAFTYAEEPLPVSALGPLLHSEELDHTWAQVEWSIRVYVSEVESTLYVEIRGGN